MVEGDSLWGIANKHGTDYHKIMEINGLTSKDIRPGQVFIMPEGSTNLDGNSPAPAPTPTLSDFDRIVEQTDKWCFCSDYIALTDDWHPNSGKPHFGIDLGNWSRGGYAVDSSKNRLGYAPINGKIIIVDETSDAGKYIIGMTILQNRQKVRFWKIKHCSEIHCNVGDIVSMHQDICREGKTGTATEHFHYEQDEYDLNGLTDLNAIARLYVPDARASHTVNPLLNCAAYPYQVVGEETAVTYNILRSE